MKRLYLAASIDRTGEDIAKDIKKETGKDPCDLKTVFINTAAEGSISEDKTWLAQDREGLVKGGLDLFDYTITNKTPKDLEKDLTDCDVIHVNGGNPFYLLLQAKKSGFDKWITDQVLKKDKIYIGSSAGTQIIGLDIKILSRPGTETDEKKLINLKGSGIIDFLIFPHWGSEKFHDLYFDYRLKFAYKPENKIILLNNWQYVKVVGDTYKIVDIRD